MIPTAHTKTSCGARCRTSGGNMRLRYAVFGVALAFALTSARAGETSGTVALSAGVRSIEEIMDDGRELETETTAAEYALGLTVAGQSWPVSIAIRLGWNTTGKFEGSSSIEFWEFGLGVTKEWGTKN